VYGTEGPLKKEKEATGLNLERKRRGTCWSARLPQIPEEKKIQSKERRKNNRKEEDGSINRS